MGPDMEAPPAIPSRRRRGDGEPAAELLAHVEDDPTDVGVVSAAPSFGIVPSCVFTGDPELSRAASLSLRGEVFSGRAVCGTGSGIVAGSGASELPTSLL